LRNPAKNQPHSNRPPVVISQDDEDTAFAIQYEYVINEAEDEPITSVPVSTQPLSQDTTLQKRMPFSYKLQNNPQTQFGLIQSPNEINAEECLSLEEIIQRYKNGEPVGDYVNVFIALYPKQAAQLDELLNSEISTQSILSNIQEYYKQCLEKKPEVVDTHDFFEINYNEPDDEYDDFEYDDDFDYED